MGEKENNQNAESLAVWGIAKAVVGAHGIACSVGVLEIGEGSVGVKRSVDKIQEIHHMKGGNFILCQLQTLYLTVKP